MKIAVITQKLDPTDYVFGFFYGHIIDLAKNCEEVHVVCLECAGGLVLPKNVTIHSLGKDEGKSKFEYIKRLIRFIVTNNSSYDTVLVHMEPLYVLAGGIWWRLTGKRIVLWYNHIYRDRKLTVASWFVDEIISASKAGVPIPHKNIQYVSYSKDLTALLTGK